MTVLPPWPGDPDGSQVPTTSAPLSWPADETPPSPVPADVVTHASAGRPAEPKPRLRKRGRRTTTAALVGVMTSAALVGAGLYFTLALIDVLSLEPARGVATFGVMTVVGLFGGFAALIASVVAVARARSLLAVVTLVAATCLPVVAAVAGIQLGASALVAHTQEDLGSGGRAALATVDQWSSDNGVSLGPLLEWILRDRER